MKIDSAEILSFASARDWEKWLMQNHGSSKGVWLRIGKKNGALEVVGISDALDVALCHGWIDSRRRGLDEDSFLQRFSPRRPKSPWSVINVTRVEALTREKRMRASGLAEVAAAKADGRWTAASVPQREAETPRELASALRASAPAKQAFEALSRSARYLLFLPILQATTPAQRSARAARVVQSLERSLGASVEARSARTAPKARAKRGS